MRYCWDFPPPCKKCGKQKTKDVGKWIKDKRRYACYYWICFSCLDKPVTKRVERHQHYETPAEKTVRQALFASGHFVEAEYPIGKFIYDFAVPRLRLLIEVDSKTYHRTRSQKIRDAVKTKLAESEGWKVARLRPHEGMDITALRMVNDRAAELGL